MAELYDRGQIRSRDGQARVQIPAHLQTWLHATVVDLSTGKPTPVRMHSRSPEGRYLPPYGRRHEVNDNWFEDCGGDLKLNSTEYAYVDGQYQIELPIGEVYVEIAEGSEFRPRRSRL
jgi:hypothetical protein